MAGWSFLSKHGRVLLCIATDPGARLRDIAAIVGITERSAYGIVTDLAAAGYAVKRKDGRRNRGGCAPRHPPGGSPCVWVLSGSCTELSSGAARNEGAT